MDKINHYPARRTARSLLICAALFLLCSNALWAEEAGSAGNIQLEGFPAGKIIDHPVRNGQGEQLGEIDDLVVKRNGTVKKAILSLGGFLEIDEKQIALRYASLEISRTGKGQIDISCAFSKEQLKQRPEFDYSKNGLEKEYYYARPRYGPRSPRFWRPNERYFPPLPGGAFYPAQMLAGAVVGRLLIDDQDNQLGVVKDLIISPEGKVKHVILSTPGVFGSEKLVALPYQPIGFTNHGLVYSGVTEEQIRRLPSVSYPGD